MRSAWLVLLSVAVLSVSTGCPDDGPIEEEVDAGQTRRDATARVDATPDAMVLDGALPDAMEDSGEPDAAEPDAAEPDATEPDASEPDATEPDATEPDANEPDANEPDATEPDASEADATELDADALDAGEPDAAALDAAELDATALDATALDAAAPDAAPDAAAPDATPITDAGTATVLVIENGLPLANADLVIGDPTGTAIATAQTAASGLATVTVPPNGMITALLRNAPGAGHFHTVAGVMPGDSLRVGSDAEPDTTPVTSVDATLSSLFPGATYFEVDAGCTASSFFGMSATFDVPAQCVAANGTISLITRAEDATGVIAYAVLTDVTPVLGGITTVSFGAWRTDFTTYTLEVQNAPALSEYVYAEHHLRRHGITYPRMSAQMQMLAPGGGHIFLFAEPNAFADELELLVYLRFTGTFAEPALGRRVPVIDTSELIDLTTDMPARIASAILDTSNPQRPQIDWTTAAPLPAMDAITIYSSWIKGTGRWTLTLPPATLAPFQYPEIPPPLDTALPPGPGIFEIPGVWIFVETPPAGYAGHKTATLPHVVYAHDPPPNATEARVTRW